MAKRYGGSNVQNSKKETQYMRCNEHDDLDVWLSGKTMRRGKIFKHHGSTLADDE